jgi:hypothetical protein
MSKPRQGIGLSDSRKGQQVPTGNASQTAAEQFYILALEITKSDNFIRLHRKFATQPALDRGRHAPRDAVNDLDALD